MLSILKRSLKFWLCLLALQLQVTYLKSCNEGSFNKYTILLHCTM